MIDAMASKNPPRTLIEGWSIIYTDTKGNCYDAPETSTQHLNGRRPDGKVITSSPIVDAEGGCLITRSGSRYELGQPHADYESVFPNANNRALTVLVFHETTQADKEPIDGPF